MLLYASFNCASCGLRLDRPEHHQTVMLLNGPIELQLERLTSSVSAHRVPAEVCMMQVMQAPATQARQAPHVALRRSDSVLPLELGVASNSNAEVIHCAACNLFGQ